MKSKVKISSIDALHSPVDIWIRISPLDGELDVVDQNRYALKGNWGC